ncbi:MAG: hypothetical protein COV75_04385 [Candidatus Omnitrophica bacterium CG11_big_fil_rev_8_21_14_0_20_63_9]|nr:MAG: hypothetical protein COV75_04385 [Candidatus Omnitrophica bacterium CG11_big_fil_rev_8_21_14_0_20_63_9]
MFAMRIDRWLVVLAFGWLAMMGTTVAWADSDSETVQVLIIIPERSPSTSGATRLASASPAPEPAHAPVTAAPTPGSTTSAWIQDQNGPVLRHTYTELN